MTITVSLTNPAEHQPSELRALATFLNNLAADRESGRIVGAAFNPEQYKIVDDQHDRNPVAPTIIPDAPVVPAPDETVQPGPGGEIPNVPDVSTPAPAELGETALEDSETSSDTTLADSEGVMYDARIHSETKSQNKNGTWRQKRGVDPELVKAVLVEQSGTAPVAPDVPAVPEVPAVPAVPTPAAPVAADAAVLPADVIKFVTGNKIEAAQALEVYSAFGLKNAAGLFQQPELAGDVLDAMRQLVG